MGSGNHNRNKDRDAHWWDGLELAPVRTKHGLLGRVWDSYQQRLTRASSQYIQTFKLFFFKVNLPKFAFYSLFQVQFLLIQVAVVQQLRPPI